MALRRQPLRLHESSKVDLQVKSKVGNLELWLTVMNGEVTLVAQEQNQFAAFSDSGNCTLVDDVPLKSGKKALQDLARAINSLASKIR